MASEDNNAQIAELFDKGLKQKTDSGKQQYNFPGDLGKINPRCQLCGKQSYQAETITYNRIPYHNNCFRCFKCNKKLRASESNPFGNERFLCNAHFKNLTPAQLNLYKKRESNVSASSNKSTTEEFDIDVGIQQCGETGKQSYRYPEDLTGPDARIDPRCHKCGKTTYQAEKVTYESIPYHKNCFRCGLCNRRLLSGDANPFGDDTFLCNTHYKQTITKTAKIGTIQKHHVNTDKRISSASYTDEEIKDLLIVGLEQKKNDLKQIYSHLDKVKDPASSIDPPCQKCGKKVYQAEKAVYEKIPYHKTCFKCFKCNRKINVGEANPFGNAEFLCKSHYDQEIKGIVTSIHKPKYKNVDQKTSNLNEEIDLSEGIAQKKAGKSQSYKFPEDVDGPSAVPDPRCNLCGKRCYQAEKVTYESIPYHKNCFKCLKCKTKLSSGNANPFGEDVYLCNTHFKQIVHSLGTCLSKKASPSTFKKPAKMDEISIEQRIMDGLKWLKVSGKQEYKYKAEKTATPFCNFCGKKAYCNEILTYNQIPYHFNCFRCFQCSKKLVPGNANPFGEDVYLCNVHYSQNMPKE